MFGLEIILALLLKFWTILYGLVFGTISSLPALHRSLLSRQLRVNWYEADSLIVQSADRELHIGNLTVIAIHAGKSVIGVITKTDLPEAQPDAVEALLRAHGIHGRIFRVSPDDPAALQALKEVLLGVDATAKECFS